MGFTKVKDFIESNKKQFEIRHYNVQTFEIDKVRRIKDGEEFETGPFHVFSNEGQDFNIQVNIMILSFDFDGIHLSVMHQIHMKNRPDIFKMFTMEINNFKPVGVDISLACSMCKCIEDVDKMVEKAIKKGWKPC